jgi:hypothetical protein
MMDREQVIESARLAYVEAWESAKKKIGRGIAPKGTKSRAGIEAALRVFELAYKVSDRALFLANLPDEEVEHD